MLGILVFINIVVFISFVNITVSVEERVLIQRTNDIIQELDMSETRKNKKEVLKDNLATHTLIRVMLPNGKTDVEVSSDPELTKIIKGKFSKRPVTQRKKIQTPEGDEQVLITRQPITSNHKTVATLEMTERLIGLEARKDILIILLSVCTILAVLLSLLGGRWLSNTIIRPISNMIQTMEEIERSGVPKKIVVHVETKDELQKMASTFNRMIERLQGNLEKQKQFISDASHELKTPLTVIKSYASLLRRRGVDNREMTSEAVEAIYSEVTRIQKMTDTFLEMATIENEVQIDRKRFDLIALCEEIIKNLKQVYRRELILHYNENPVFIAADELKIKQVVIIFLDNALKYSTGKIEIFIEKAKGAAVIRIRDYGIGIPQEEIENIFERFYRVDKARSRATGGTGLGLSIAKNIINLHKGEIDVKSKEGEGTEIQIILPFFDD